MLKLLVLSLALVSLSARTPTETCDVVEVYSGQRVKTGTLAKNSFGAIVEVQELLTPTTLDPGKYLVTLHDEGDNVYRVGNKDLYLKTQYCYPTTGSEVVLSWKSNYAFFKGTIISE